MVSPRFRDLVESFEAGVHQFVPVEIYRKPNGQPVATYYWFIICQRLDSVDREHTTYAWKAPADDPAAGHWASSLFDRQLQRRVEVPNAKLVFSNRQVSGRHIWHDPHVLTFNNGLCSDAFAEAALGGHFRGFDAVPRESV